jgi:DNA-binding NtrC family response regulator
VKRDGQRPPKARGVNTETSGQKAMSDIFDTDRTGACERVLIVAPDAALTETFRAEISGRGAQLVAAQEIGIAAKAVRRQRFDVILVAAREDAGATALLAALLKAEARGAPRLLLLLDADRASRYDAAILAADEVVALSLSPKRICDTAGVGATTGYPRMAAFG